MARIEKAYRNRTCHSCRETIKTGETHLRIYGFRGYENICQSCMNSKLKEIRDKNRSSERIRKGWDE